ncbi:MAG TPA: hypothetical protein VMR37_08545, partial [Rhabdochlamydiaceae bacterium]|nr:hypothetical protein [Rhabdochlamydiaceae bacterium]
TFVENVPLHQYDWTVIRSTFKVLYSGIGSSLKTTFFLLVTIPITLALGYFWYLMVPGPLSYLYSQKHIDIIPAIIGPFVVLMFPTVISMAVGASFDYRFRTHFLPVLKQTQKAYRDPYVAYQALSRIPNSMHGFDLKTLANGKTGKGEWLDPITLDPIPANQISTNQILCFGQYALPIKTALTSMLTRAYKPIDCPPGEIPHPIEIRKLTPNQKVKFLREVSAFFAISDPRKIQDCWNVQVRQWDLAPFIFKINQWEVLPVEIQGAVIQDLTQQILPIKRKQAFLSLLTNSAAQTYFDDEFRSTDVKIPNIQVSIRPISMLDFLLIAALASRRTDLEDDTDEDDTDDFDSDDEPPSSISGQSGNAGRP